MAKSVLNISYVRNLTLLLYANLYYFNTTYPERSFLYARPLAWNQLLSSIRSAHNMNSFKQLLKTHLFHISFG